MSSLVRRMFFAWMVFLLASLDQTCAASNSLSVRATFISGDTEFPEMSILVMINDVAVEYYDSNIQKLVSRSYWRTNATVEEADLKRIVIEDFYKSIKFRALHMMKRFNHTQGIHVFQRFLACDLVNDSLSRFYTVYAYNGEENIRYDVLAQTRSAEVPEFIWSKFQSEAKKVIYTNVYQPLCVRTLQKYLLQDRNHLLRKVHPRVRVIQKRHPDSGELQVSCLATGFYPPHINLSLLRDGQAIPQQQMSGGELLPNGDGTYQMRRSLRVNGKDLQAGHRYTCTVTHLSLDNRLDVNWEQTPPDAVIISVVVLLVVAFAGLIIATAAVLCRRRTGCEPSAGVRYTAAHKNDASDTSSSSSGTSNL